MAPSSSLFFLSFFSIFPLLFSLSVSNSPVPPLQWINLSSLLLPSNSPPALKDAAIGYDDNSRSLVIFGGESQAGISQSQTYLLNLDSLAWSTPSPPSGLSRVPPARSAAIAGTDFAANYRHGFVVIGGKGDQGQPLSDVWEYDFNNQFWSQVSIPSGGPSPRWGASGGIDIRVTSTQDPRLASPNNTFYLAGGLSGPSGDSLSDVWRFNITGTLSPNFAESSGSWDHLTIGSLPVAVGQGGTVTYSQVVVVGGCNSTSGSPISCAQQASYVITTNSKSLISPQPCPPPRYGPAVVPNLNSYSSSFAHQVFVLSGLYNTSLWNVGGATNSGEIDVLDTNGGTWTRVLPSGDPGTTGHPTYPVAREGAAAVAYTGGLVGQNRGALADIVMFGGRDASGQYLSDLWLLRSYGGSVTASSPNWSGYGNGQLQTGADASGSGVKVQFPNTCATLIAESNTATSTSPRATSTVSSNHTPSAVFNTSIIHKVFAPLSVALLLPSMVYFRLTLSTFSDYKLPEHQIHWFYTCTVVAFLAFALGIVGLAMSFASISSSVHSSRLILQTDHGRAGLAFFICLFGVAPALLLLRYFITYSTSSSEDDRSEGTDRRIHSLNASEKLSSLPGPIASTPHSTQNSPPSSPRTRSHSFGPAMRPRTTEGAISSDTESISSGTPHRTFEVLNRPPRNRNSSSHWAQMYTESSHHSHQPLTPRSLGDVDWLLRRRSLNAVDELDYAITQFHNARLGTPATTDRLLNAPMSTNSNAVALPPFVDVVIHILLHASLLGICVISLVALWYRAPKAAFAIFLVWTVLFYVIIFSFSWFGRPEKSVLSVVIYRLRGKGSSADRPQNDQPPTHDGPYLHQLPHRPATRDEMAHARPLSMTTDDDDDNIDEDTRQRMIEEEMERRDVSIVTVPRRRLWIANPS
ncbi:hypothetical protein AX15_002116 [Amanita polypyramis BW_CC]|nr:hypothetical protein AX15_002116 [Amanita polypyramis BW_CC]